MAHTRRARLRTVFIQLVVIAAIAAGLAALPAAASATQPDGDLPGGDFTPQESTAEVPVVAFDLDETPLLGEVSRGSDALGRLFVWLKKLAIKRWWKF